MQSYRSVAEVVRVEPDRIKGSRHIATLAPIEDEAGVARLLAGLRAEFPGANHHAYAWRLGQQGESFRYSDDGEPGGTAGRPILQHLEGREVTHVVCVVTRFFGGTKLGAGGLVRAYGGAAAAALAAARIVTVVPKAMVRVTYPYACSNAMQAVVHAREVAAVAADYGEHVVQVFEVVAADVAAFEREVADATAGAAVIERMPSSS